jgi:hypothetical protein
VSWKLFSQAIDEAVVRMGSRESPLHQDKVDKWLRALPLLGMIRLAVFVFDPLDECRGIYSAAFDGWRHGNSLWPV